MANVAIVTDSTADIPADLQKQLGISVVPLKVNFGEESYLDGIELTAENFYRKLADSQVFPTTSQPSPAEFFEVYKPLVDAGRPVVSVHLSSAFSGTYQSARIAQSMLEGDHDVTVIDSRSASYGYGYIVVAAAKMAARGEPADKIVEAIHRLRRELRLYFVVDTLEYLQKGGRIGKASAFVGSLLNIKPILTIDDEGIITPVDKVRGQKRAFARIVELLKADFGDRPIHLNIAKTPGFDQTAQEVTTLIRSQFEICSFHEAAIGSVIGTHAGPGTVGIFAWPADDADPGR
jgi:DegV family protein with EDD domain